MDGCMALTALISDEDSVDSKPVAYAVLVSFQKFKGKELLRIYFRSF